MAGTLFHDKYNQLLLALLMPVERQSRGKLFNQRVHQLLLIVAEMATIGKSVASKIPYCESR